MLEDSDLLQRDVLVLRATAPLDARVWLCLEARPKL
jgi:hypothetical protein